MDWGEASEFFDKILGEVNTDDILSASEAQTRYHVIDRIVREVLHWNALANVSVEDRVGSQYIDYFLSCGDSKIVIEAKKAGAAFPSPTRREKLKISGSVLGVNEVRNAIEQAAEYARGKSADLVVVTNGLCWIVFKLEGYEEGYASLYFPFERPGQMESMFDVLSLTNVDRHGLHSVTNSLPLHEERLIDSFNVGDGRVDRNNIADHITPALDLALHSDAILSDQDILEKCFVSTEMRTKFDSMLGMHFSDAKPPSVSPARRIRRNKEKGDLESIIDSSSPGFAPPVTLIIGPVGAGKSTYLKHFELVSGRQVLAKKEAHWVYIDFEGMGKGGDPRKFLYRQVRNYLDRSTRVSANNVIDPAYKNDIDALADGPLSRIKDQKAEFDREVSRHIKSEYDEIEPYVDKVLKYLTKKCLCVIVLDNVDLYEDTELEKSVFSEGLAISKRAYCNVIVSLRGKTFVKHKTDSVFDAYELRKLWLDPPPLREVLSTRFSYAKKVLSGKSVEISTSAGHTLKVKDMGVFFDIVQRSILREASGDLIESLADSDIRKGISLVRNFLTSGHIQADIALKNYLVGDSSFFFPFHEVFKGGMLGQWRHFKEERTEGVNIFDARYGSKRLRLLRFFILNYFYELSKFKETAEVPVSDLVSFFADASASDERVIDCLTFLERSKLIRSLDSEEVSISSICVLTKIGGYYARVLSRRFVYVEECMYDTAIDDQETWKRLHLLTAKILSESSPHPRMLLRKERMQVFLEYLGSLESATFDSDVDSNIFTMNEVAAGVNHDLNYAIERTGKRSKRSGAKTKRSGKG